MHKINKIEQFSVKYIRTSKNGWVAIFDEDELKDFAVSNLLRIRILELAEAIKKWRECGVVGEFYTLAALRYYTKMDRVRRYLGKKGNRFVDQVKEKYLVHTHEVMKVDQKSSISKNKFMNLN